MEKDLNKEKEKRGREDEKQDLTYPDMLLIVLDGNVTRQKGKKR